MNLTRQLRLAVSAALAVLSAAAHANSYEIIDLGEHRYPTQISNGGQISGTKVDGGVRAMQWRAGHWHNLSRSSGGEGQAVNKHGQVAGNADWPTIWTRGVPEEIRPDDIKYGDLTAIADDGSAAGWYVHGEAGQLRSCLTVSPEGGVSSQGFPDECYVTGMNNRGQVIGYAPIRHQVQGFIWKDGKYRRMGVLPGMRQSTPLGINYFGQVVGYSHDSTTGRAFLWSDSAMTEIGQSDFYLGTFAYAINNRGEIVGTGQKPDKHAEAVRFPVGGAPVPLASEVANIGDWVLVSAQSINDEGVIVGFGTRTGLVDHAFMLRPIP